MRVLLLNLTFAAMAVAQCTAVATTDLGATIGGIGGQNLYGDAGNSNKLVSRLTTSSRQCDVAYEMGHAVYRFYTEFMPTEVAGHPMYYRYPAASVGNPPSPTTAVNTASGNIAIHLMAGIEWKRFTGQRKFLDNAIVFANYVLSNSQTQPTDAWPSVWYSSGDPGAITYYGYSDGATNVLEPDKLARLGYALVKMYEETGDSSWLTKATHIADVLCDRRVLSTDYSHSPWQFRVNAITGATMTSVNSGDAYTGTQYEAAQLFDELITINQHGVHSIADYTTARDAAVAWMITYPVANHNWDNCCEDISGQLPGTNITTTGLGAAVYFAQRVSRDANYATYAANIITFMEGRFGVSFLGSATGFKEQDLYANVTVSGTLIGAMSYAWMSKITTGATSTAYKDKALRALNLATYLLDRNFLGQVHTGPEVNDQYFLACGPVPIVDLAQLGQMFPEWGAAPAPVIASGGVFFGLAAR